MAAKIGILGETTVSTTDVTTIYTVPADKAARVRIQFAVEGSATQYYEYSCFIGSPGTEITVHRAPAVNVDLWSGVSLESSQSITDFYADLPDPTLSLVATAQGVQEVSGGLDLDTPTSTKDWWIAPLPTDYFLSTGDTVKVNIADSNGLDHLAQVIGVEDDA